jgi:urease gamma subunit
MRANYVLIDYENVQPETLSILDAENFKVLVFVGANQVKLLFETAAALQQMGNKAEYIKISGNGPNALDFHIAFYIGQLAASDPTAYFHIIFKDTGFDPLIQHLKSKRLFAARSRDVSEIPLLKVANTKTPAEKIAVIVANLQQRGASKPRTVKTLLSTVNSIFQKQLAEQELAELLKDLQTESYIIVNGTKVSYALPTYDTQHPNVRC